MERIYKELYMNDPEMEREFVEVEKVFKETSGRKALGIDDLQIELLKEAGKE